jgi:hypothetical protein
MHILVYINDYGPNLLALNLPDLKKECTIMCTGSTNAKSQFHIVSL